MAHHLDPSCDRALLKLSDELCTWERMTGRGSTLILFPDSADEAIQIFVDGKPIEVEDSVALAVLLAEAVRTSKNFPT